MVAMGAGIPEHYLASGESSNRATAAEMAFPTVKKFKRGRTTSAARILARVVQEKQARGLLPAGIDTSLAFTFPDIDTDDNLALGQASLAVAQSLQIAKAQGWVTDETAARLYFESLGEDLDAAGEVSAANAENAGPRPTGQPPEQSPPTQYPIRAS
jgi:hypothetical protein